MKGSECVTSHRLLVNELDVGSVMITLFACPKSFEVPHDAVIQENAIASWRQLGIDVLLLGDDPGVFEVAQKYGCQHIKEILVNDFGTPLLSSIFQQAEKHAQTELLCYVNSDIIFTGDIKDMIMKLNAESLTDFLCVGRRRTIELKKRVSFPADQKLKDLYHNADFDAYNAIDYFIFRKGTIEMKPFAIGRPAWDNWTLWKVLQDRFLLIDASESITAIHQRHDYGHVKERVGNSWEGPEALENRRLAGGYRCMADMRDSTHLLREGKLKVAKDWLHIKRKIYQWLRSIKHKVTG